MKNTAAIAVASSAPFLTQLLEVFIGFPLLNYAV
jgi:hypothetical protein